MPLIGPGVLLLACPRGNVVLRRRQPAGATTQDDGAGRSTSHGPGQRVWFGIPAVYSQDEQVQELAAIAVAEPEKLLKPAVGTSVAGFRTCWKFNYSDPDMGTLRGLLNLGPFGYAVLDMLISSPRIQGLAPAQIHGYGERTPTLPWRCG